jgi:hypothetical protein
MSTLSTPSPDELASAWLEALRGPEADQAGRGGSPRLPGKRGSWLFIDGDRRLFGENGGPVYLADASGTWRLLRSVTLSLEAEKPLAEELRK